MDLTKIPGVLHVGPERRESSAQERKRFRMASGESGNGNGITITPGFLAALISLLLGLGGVGGSALKKDATTSSQDHDAITAIGIELRVMKESQQGMKTDIAETNKLVRRLVYGSKAAREVEVP